jgi:hypothetical protein
MTQEEAFDTLVCHDLGFKVRPGELARAVCLIAEVVDGKRINETAGNHDMLLTLVRIAKEAL